MKRKMKCVVLVFFLTCTLSACNSTSTSKDESSSISVATDESSDYAETNVEQQGTESDLVVSTEYGELHYPEQWREYIEVKQSSENDTLTVAFSTQSDGNEYVLFDIVIGSSEELQVGTLTDDDDVQRNVYLQMNEFSTDGLQEGEINRLYAMQEDLNYLIENLK